MNTKKDCGCKCWEARNNSANVAAVINPKMHSRHLQKNTPFSRKTSCYCKGDLVAPQLFSRPKECILTDSDVSDDDFGTREKFTIGEKSRPKLYQTNTYSCLKDLPNKSDVKRRKNRFSENSYTSFPTVDIGETEPSSIFKNYYNTVGYKNGQRSSIDSSDLNQPSVKISKNYEQVGKDFYKEVSTGEDSEKKNKEDLSIDYNNNGRHKSNNQNLEVVTSFEEENIRKSKPPPSIEKSSKSDLKQLRDFRTDHYFETHSTEDLFKSVPEHICVHSFGLDNRLLPQPLHTDVYDISRCIICGKPMENPPINRTDEREVKKKNIFPKFYKYGLAPKKIYLGNGENIRIDMKLKGKNEVYKCDMPEKPNYYYDSYALRYQKGVT